MVNTSYAPFLLAKHNSLGLWENCVFVQNTSTGTIFCLTFVKTRVNLCSRIRGAALRVVSLRRSAPARSPSNSRKLTGEFHQCFPTLLGRYPRSQYRAQTTTAGREPTRQCFCVRNLLERHGVSRERLQGRCEVPDRRRKPTHQPVRRGSKATSRALYGMSQGNRWLGFPLLRDLALPGYKEYVDKPSREGIPSRTRAILEGIQAQVWQGKKEAQKGQTPQKESASQGKNEIAGTLYWIPSKVLGAVQSSDYKTATSRALPSGHQVELVGRRNNQAGTSRRISENQAYALARPYRIVRDLPRETSERKTSHRNDCVRRAEHKSEPFGNLSRLSRTDSSVAKGGLSGGAE